MELKRATVLHVPSYFRWTDQDLWFFVDPEGPHWISTDGRGARLLEWLAEPAPFGELVSRYASAHTVELPKAWLHVSTFLHELLRVGFAQPTPIAREPYLGRAAYLAPRQLSEAWIHTNNSCNLTCTHCLVSSSPSGSRGLPTESLLRLIDQFAQMGAGRFYFTGGEPFVRRDIFELIEHVTRRRQAELIVLTNASLFRGETLKRLDACDRALLRLQVSVDGATAATNDPIRGAGSFEAATHGLRRASTLGFQTSLTTAVTATNCAELTQVTRLAKELGATAQHLMWLHKRGRVLESARGWFPSREQLITAVLDVKRCADALGVVVDNYESFRMRVNGPAHIKYDLGNQGWSSFCVYADGHAYPSAAFANDEALDCGDALNGLSLKDLWLNSPVFQRIRQASVARKPSVAGDPFRFFTGGGDIEHSYYYSGGDFLGEDPYYPLYVAIIKDVMRELASVRREAANRRSGYDAPRLYHAMGEGAIACGQAGPSSQGPVEVSTLHSNCVLAFDVEKPRALVRGFYTKAAEQPQAELCCPIKYDDADISHIPTSVIERFYGCGSPIAMAQPRSGEVVVDLGCGAGIDCFVAAKRVGPAGKAYGIDMTDAMLEVAAQAKIEVAGNLGYDVVEFRKGFLERVPVEDKTADLVISNCVINLSPDKRAVFGEMWRVLKDHGRMCVADIVSERPVPAHLKVNPQLWGECTVGALTEEEFLAYAEQAGFYGVQVLKRSFYRTIDGHHFFSMTIRGHKFEKTAGCTYIGQTAIYLGPFKGVSDEEGHWFPRSVAVEVCTDTAAKLSQPPYRASFTVIDPTAPVGEIAASQASTNGCGPGCC